MGLISDSPKWRMKTRSSVDILQPLVQVQCTIYDKDEMEENGNLKTAPMLADKIDCFKDSNCEAIKRQVEPVYFEKTLDFTNIYEMKDITADGFSTITYRAQYGYIKSEEDMVVTEEGVWVTGCVAMAHWVPSALTVDPAIPGGIKSDFNITGEKQLEQALESLDEPKAISLDESWNLYLNPFHGSSDRSLDLLFISMNEGRTNPRNSSESTYYLGPGSALGRKSADASVAVEALQNFISVLLAEALAHTVHTSWDWEYSPKLFTSVADHEANWTALNDQVNGWSDQTFKWTDEDSPMTMVSSDGRTTEDVDFTWNDVTSGRVPHLQLDFDVMKFGYANGNPGGTMAFALGVMYFYLGILVVYAVWATFARATAITRWDDMAELVALAWKSAPPQEMLDTGVHIRRNMWTRNVAVRANERGQVQLVMGEYIDSAHMERISKGKYV